MGKHTPKNTPLRRYDATKRSKPPAAAQLSLGLGDETPDHNRRPRRARGTDNEMRRLAWERAAPRGNTLADINGDLQDLIDLGYASDDPAMREAAGWVDTWKSKLAIFLFTMKLKNDHSRGDYTHVCSYGVLIDTHSPRREGGAPVLLDGWYATQELATEALLLARRRYPNARLVAGLPELGEGEGLPEPTDPFERLGLGI